jgi:hypothetical protein
MKRFLFVAIAAVTLSGCMEKGPGKGAAGPMFRGHWTGANKVSGGTNALAKIAALPSSTDLRNEAFAKLARFPQEFWKKTLPDGVADQSAQFRPLLDDLWANESLVELRGSPARPDLIVAAEIEEQRAELWSKHLRQAATAWKMTTETPLEAGSAKGWSVAGKDMAIHWARSGKWVLAAITHGSKAPFDDLLKSERPVPALAGTIAEIQADWPRLNQRVPLLANYSLPPMELKVSARSQSLRTEGKLMYPDRLPIKLEPWKIPTNIVTEPLISFTCLQGFAPWLKHVKGVSDLHLKNPPNQLFTWGLGTLHAQTLVAVPMPDATNVVRDLAPRLPQFIKVHFTNSPGQFLWISNRAEWIWSDLPMIIPYVRPQRLRHGDYLVAGMFPMKPGSNTAPAELLRQVTTRTNLVYYDWEITQDRLSHAREIIQLVDIINKRRISTTNMASHRWSLDIAPFLGNSITEIALTSPSELSFVRKSDIGFTGFELMLFTRWLESPNFPLSYEPPPLISARRNRPPGPPPSAPKTPQ